MYYNDREMTVNMMDNIVSIIVPVYNVISHLPDCLNSITGQTHKTLQIIIVDDGSTDGSGEICDDYAKRDSRITVIHQDNAGSANAKNAGLDAATGHFIAFVDSDDWVESNWIEKMLAVSIKNDADVVECSFLKEFVSQSENGNDSNFTSTIFKTEDYLLNYRGNWTCALFWNKLYRSNILKNIRFHKERRCIDDEFFTYKAVTGANGKSVISGQERGFVKVVYEKSTGRILGAQMMCARASDMISEFTQAIAAELTLEDMHRIIRPHPTFEEIITQAVCQ
jgi:glycosyltransferase involved in cell wall biosynthesis